MVARLVGGDGSRSLTTVMGRVEVRKFGVWGTICDDDFGDAEASVVCNSLGYKGSAKVGFYVSSCVHFKILAYILNFRGRGDILRGEWETRLSRYGVQMAFT